MGVLKIERIKKIKKKCNSKIKNNKKNGKIK